MSINVPPTIAAKIEQFTGRTWLLPKVVDWYERTDERILMISGGPGTGKSMIMAWLAGDGPAPYDPAAREQLVQIRAQVKGAHFCMAASGSTAPKALAQNLAEQLTRNVPGFADALAASLAELVTITPVQKVERMEPGASMTGVQIGTLNLAGLGEELSFNRTLREPLQKLYENGYSESVLLLVDALDEALTYTGVIDIVRLLAKLEDLPEQVHFLVTSRPDERVLYLLPGAGVFHLDRDVPPDQKPGQDDVCRYVQKRLKALAPGQKEEQRKALARRISLAAEGIFLYAHLLLADLERGVRQVADLEMAEPPRGLPGLYQEFLNRELGVDRRAWRKTFRPVLGLIAVAQGEGLSATQLERLTGEDVDVEEALEVCRQYLEGELPEGPFRVFHRSFSDFLLQEPKNKAYRVDAADMHSRIATHYWAGEYPDWQKLRDVLDGGYGLDSLAAHLHLAGQGDRLKALINQPWMAARFEGSGYTYDGFLADLMLAWQAAHEEALAQIEADQEPASMADCVRYALLRTSLNSLSANYVPALVARAVETRLWPAERALSVASQVPDAKARAGLFSALLATGKLNAEQSTRAQKAGLEAALAVKIEWSRASALAALAPQLTGEARTQALAQGLEAALAASYEGFRAAALMALAPQLTGELLAQGLQAALAIEDDRDRAEALAALAPQLTGEARIRALVRGLEAAMAIQWSVGRSAALVALAPQLTGELLAQGLQAALAIEDDRDRAETLAALAPHLRDEARIRALSQGLEAALAAYGPEARAEVQAALASHLMDLPGKRLAPGLETALAIENDEHRAEALERGLAAALAMGRDQRAVVALAAFASHLTGEARHQALERGLDLTLTIEEEFRPNALESLAPHLRGEALEWALDAVLALWSEQDRAYALHYLAPHLTGEGAERGLDAALAIPVEEDRARVLAALAPQLTGEARERGLDAALTIRDWGKRTEAFAGLAPWLSGEALARGLDAALTIEDGRNRAEALAVLASQLTGQARTQTLAMGLEVVPGIKDERDRADALAGLASQSTGEAQVQTLARGLEAALAIQWSEARAQVLAALAPQLTGEARTQALAQGLEATLDIQVGWRRGRALHALAPQLVGEALARGLEAAVTIEDKELQAEALTAVASQLEREAEALARELEQALAIDNERDRAEALAFFAPQLMGEALALAALAPQLTDKALALAVLAPHSVGEALAKGLVWAGEVRWQQARWEALAALAPQLTGEALALARGLEAALAAQPWRFAGKAPEREMQAAHRIPSAEPRFEALVAQVPQLVGEALARGLQAVVDFEDEEYRAMVAAFLYSAPDPEAVLRAARKATADCLLNRLSAVRREVVLKFCADRKVFAPPFLDQDTLATIAGHIVEVCEEWKWM